ncbi:MAG: c-type cytochrome [Burkholderiales bacterium]|nr:c-type cytochrome [Burkholderiales bacterium]
MKTIGLLAACALMAAGAAAAQDRNLGRNLAAQCANCHGTNGQSQGGIPGLAGQGRAYLIAQMNAFKTGQRSGPASTIMHQLAKGYTDEQIALMADFFAAQKPGK